MTDKPRWLEIFEKFISQLRINSKETGGNSKFALWDSQRMFLKCIADGLDDDVRMFVCLKSRQLGVSTVSLAIDLFWLATHPGMLGALITDTEANRDAFRSILKQYLKSFPPGFLGKSFSIIKGGDNRNFMEFSNGSRLDFLVAGLRKKKTLGELRAYSLCHGTEMANWGDANGIASFMETLSQTNPNRLYMFELTAKGFNHFQEFWHEAGRDVFTKRRIFIGWWSNPYNRLPRSDRRFPTYGTAPPTGDECELINIVSGSYDYKVTQEQLAWYRWKSSDTSKAEQDLHQNSPWTAEQAFVATGFSFFQIRKINENLAQVFAEDNPIFFAGYRYLMTTEIWSTKMEEIVDQTRLDEVELKVWEEPVNDAQYLIGVDPAYGRNEWKDRHCISVFRGFADCLVQVAEYATSEVDTRSAAWVMAHLAGAYRNCILNVDLAGGPGRVLMTELDHVRQLIRAEMYQRQVSDLKWDDFLQQARWYLYHRPDQPGPGYAYNFVTSMERKKEMMQQFRDSHVTDQLVIRSSELLQEMVVVTQNGDSIEAPGRAKDDRVFAAALANRAWIEHVRPNMIAMGETYERAMKRESGQEAPIATFMDRMVANYFLNAEDHLDDPTPAQRFLMDRGLA